MDSKPLELTTNIIRLLTKGLLPNGERGRLNDRELPQLAEFIEHLTTYDSDSEEAAVLHALNVESELPEHIKIKLRDY